MRARGLAWLALLGVGCSLPLEDQTLPYQNSCSATADCGAGAACVTTPEGGVCAATETDLGRVFIEVRSGDVSGSTTSFLFTDALVLDAPSATGIVRELDLELPALVTVKGSFPALPGTLESCRLMTTEGITSVPVKIELRSTSVLPGIQNKLSALSEIVGDEHLFELDVPPGVYDVYIAPRDQEDKPECVAAPPRFFPSGLEVTTEYGFINYRPREEPPSELSGTIQVSSPDAVVGWELEVVDPVLGKPLSPTVELGEAVGGVVPIPLTPYSYTAQALLRLRSPSGDLTAHWVLETVNNGGVVGLLLSDLQTGPLHRTATVVGPEGPVAGATVTIQSRELTGTPSETANYRLVTESDPSGVIAVDLPPGTYLVSVVPTSTSLGTFLGEWKVTAENNGGNGIGFELPLQPLLKGSVQTAGGEPAVGAPVVATPSQTSMSTYFKQALEELSLAPRQFNGSVTNAGGIELFVDPGTIDFSVQLDSTSGYPWIVRPRLVVQEWTDQTQGLDLGQLRVSYPVLVRGTVRSASGPSSLATVRAWVDAGSAAEAEKSGALVQIGETIADESGQFFLPLPPTVTQIQ